MFKKEVIRNLIMLIVVYIFLLIPILFFENYFSGPMGILIIFPVFSIYLFNLIGIPGLLEQNGACGWGWCSPTIQGWFFISIFWLLVSWVIVYAITVRFTLKK